MKMEKPTVEAVRFQSTDVIATSGELGVMLGGFGDNTSGNNSTWGNWFVSDVKGATGGTQDTATVLGYFKTASGVYETDYEKWFFQNNNGNKENFDDLSVLDNGTVPQPFDGWYTWYSDGSDSYFKWQSN